MVTQVSLSGYDAFIEYTNKIEENGQPIYFDFTGSKLPSGESWCSDCVEAEPVIKRYLANIKKNIIFVVVEVGDRQFWKDKACPFRTNTKTKLMVIPTIIQWKGVKRLEGDQCKKQELLEMLFADED